MENSDDVVKMGVAVKEQRASGSFDHKAVYNNMYDVRYQMNLTMIYT